MKHAIERRAGAYPHVDTTSSVPSLTAKGLLLVGAAAVALGAPTDAAAQPVPPEKWDAYIDLTGRFGNYTAGEIGLFIPLWQSPDSILFADLRGKMTSESTQEGNFGLGYRTQVNQDWILGVNAFFDIHNSDADNTFIQGGVGVEALTEDWDFRLNGYFPESDDKAVGGMPLIQVQGNTIQLLTGIEKALWGFDGEVGYRLPFFDPDGDTEIRVFAGGFYFDADGVEGLMGPRLRLEARIYDLDFLSNGSRLTLGAEVTHDDVRNLRGFGSVSVRVPLQLFGGSAAPKLAGLDRRMVDPVRRDFDIVTNVGYGNPEDIFVENSEVAVDTIVFGTNGGGGPGTYEGAPDSVADAFAFLGGSEGIVVVDDSGGTYNTAGLTLQDGQVLLGGGTTVKVTGAVSGEQTYFSPKGFRPTINGTNGANPLITINDDNVVAGLYLTGAFDEGIAGTVYTNFAIVDNSIFGAGGDGIDIEVVNPGSSGRVRDNTIAGPVGDGIDIDIVADDGGDHEFELYIYDNEVYAPGDDGIAVATSVVNGSSLDETIVIEGNRVARGGGDGIYVFQVASGAGSVLTQDLTIEYNSGFEFYGSGIDVRTVAFDGGFVDQANTINIIDNQFYVAYDSVIAVYTTAYDGGDIAQTLNISGNIAAGGGWEMYTSGPPANVYEFLDELGHGIFVSNAAYGLGSSLTQTINIEDNTTFLNFGVGIGVVSAAINGGVIDQANTINIVGNTTEAPYDAGYLPPVPFANLAGGIAVGNVNFYGGGFDQTLNISDNVATYNGSYLPFLAALDLISNPGALPGFIYGPGVAVTASLLSSLSGGIGVTNVGVGAVSPMTQTINITDNTANYNFGSGIGVTNIAVLGAELDQDETINITGNEASYNGLFGISLINASVLGGEIYQSGTIYDNTANGNGISGIAGINIAALYAGIHQDLTIDDNDANFNGYGLLGGFLGLGGIDVVNLALGPGANIEQSLEITDNTASYNSGYFGGDGIGVLNIALYGAQIDQSDGVTISGNTVQYNDNQGILVANVAFGYAGDAARITQTLDIDDNVVSGNGFDLPPPIYLPLIGYLPIFQGDGILVANIAGPGGELDLANTVNIRDNTVTGNYDDGIEIYSLIYDSGLMSLNANVTGNVSGYNGGGGIEIETTSVNGGIAETGITITGNTTNFNDDAGIFVDNFVYYGGGSPYGQIIQQLTIDDNTANYNGLDGIYVLSEIIADVYANAAGRITIIGSISGNSVFENGQAGTSYGDGIDITAFAGGSGHLGIDLDIDDNSIDGSYDDGLAVFVGLYEYSTATVDLAIGNNTITDNGDDGVDIAVDVNADAFAHFDVSLEGNTVTGNEEIGITVYLETDDYGEIVSDVDLIDNVVDDNGDYGVVVFVYTEGGTITTDVLFDGNTVTDNGSSSDHAGIALVTNYDGGSIDITANFVDNIVDNNYGHGIFLELDAGVMNAAFLGRNELTNNGDYGLYLQEDGGTMMVTIGGGTYFDGNGSGYVGYSGTPTIIYLP